MQKIPLSLNQKYNQHLIQTHVQIILMRHYATKNKLRTSVFPEWMTRLQSPHSEFDISPLRYDEVAGAVKRMRSGASPCPFDHVSVLILKNCPIIRTQLHKILQYCWETHSVTKTWKHGFTVLIYMKGESSNPANFRPITLEPVCLKILSSIVRRRLYSFLVKNNYIESEIHKASGTIFLEPLNTLKCLHI